MYSVNFLKTMCGKCNNTGLYIVPLLTLSLFGYWHLQSVKLRVIACIAAKPTAYSPMSKITVYKISLSLILISLSAMLFSFTAFQWQVAVTSLLRKGMQYDLINQK